MKLKILFLFLFTNHISTAQYIKGSLMEVKNQSIYLYSYTNFETKLIDSTLIDNNGSFSMHYEKKDHGMGFLKTKAEKSVYNLILENDDIHISGQSTVKPKSIVISRGDQNIAFQKYYKDQSKRNQALDIWRYQIETYQREDIFKNQVDLIQSIKKEINRLEQQEKDFFISLPKSSFLAWYLPSSQLLNNISKIFQSQKEKIPTTVQNLKDIDFRNPYLYKSGMIDNMILSYIWLIGNTESTKKHKEDAIKEYVDIILDQLNEDNDKLNIIAPHLLKTLHRTGYILAGDYLTKRLIEEDNCGCLSPLFEKELKSYYKTTVGQTAPNIVFSENTFFPNDERYDSLSAIKSDYYLVVFSASWCSHCQEAIPQLKNYYPELKQKNIEVVMVSLDVNNSAFLGFTSSLPFISTTDFKKWDSQAVKDYGVSATPSYFILDHKLKILQKLVSIDELKEWTKKT